MQRDWAKCRSEPVFQPELELPLRIEVAVRGGVNPSGVGVGIAWDADFGVRIPQVDMVQEVHHLEAYFDLAVLVDGEMLEQGCISAPVARAAKGIARQIAEGPFRGTSKRTVRVPDWRRVKPLSLRLWAVRIADQIRPAWTGIAIRAVVAITDIERQSALDDHVRVELPAADKRIGHRRHIRRVSASASERQFRDDRRRKTVHAIPVGWSVFKGAVVEALMLRQVGFEVGAAMLACSLQRVITLRRVSVREALGQARLQRVVSIGGAVAEVIDSLRPAELVVERPPLIARHVGISLQRGLI